MSNDLKNMGNLFSGTTRSAIESDPELLDHFAALPKDNSRHQIKDSDSSVQLIQDTKVKTPYLLAFSWSRS